MSAYLNYQINYCVFGLDLVNQLFDKHSILLLGIYNCHKLLMLMFTSHFIQNTIYLIDYQIK